MDQILGNVNDLPQIQTEEEHFSSPSQQIGAGLEGVAQGIAGPLAPLAEQGLGITTGENIRARAAANPVTHALGQAAGFAGSLAVPGLSEAGLAGQVGNIGEHAAALLPEATSAILRTGIKAGSEVAALSTSDELSKMVTQDPNQTLGSAAINIGLSGIIGGAGGVALGGVSNLWNKAANVSGADKFLSDFMLETKALQDAANPAQAAESEFASIPASADNKSAGVRAARWVNENGAATLSKAIGEGAGTSIGGALGTLAGHPLLGAVVGERALGQRLSSLAQPFLENAVDAVSAKAASSYINYAIKGQQLLDDSISNMFKNGGEVLAKNLIPDQESRDKLEKSLDYMSSPQNAINISGGIGHYLPQHTTAAAETASNALNFLNGLKPVQPVMSPMDAKPPISPMDQNKYNRALDVAQQPLLVLQHAQNGTLLPQDVQAIRTIYPGLHDSMIKKITNNFIENSAATQALPYSQRVSMNLLIGGNPLDSTMTPMAAQSIINSASPKQNAQSQATKSGKPSGSTLTQINKVNALSQTALQARQAQKRS